ncbi:3-oxoacyl-ACP synthase [Streptomyces sp. NPDC035033]|uniref:3-oxoacyl-ACP synthase n=1 Tax=Streptomyces sp. NPDC035033 TaxID=3155368 RepID=UPI0033C13123
MRVAGRITITAPTAWLPPAAVTAADALAEGRIKEEDAEATGYRSLPVATDLAPPQLAARAARRAYRRAGRTPGDTDAVLHAWIHHQGHDFWSPAHYVAHEAGALDAVPIGIQQMCNGGAAALETAATRLLSGQSSRTVLVTTADRFDDAAFDRWRGDYGLWYGDAGTAALLHGTLDAPDPDAPALLLHSVVTVAAPALETMHRGDDPFSEVPRPHGARIDVRRTKRAFLRRHGKDALAEVVRDKVAEVLRTALDEAGTAPGGPRPAAVVLPRLGRAALTDVYGPVVRGVTDAPLLDLGADTGHLGAGDVLANLADLTEGPHRLAPGEYAVLLGAGGGFTWSCLVVQRPPQSHVPERNPR